MLPFRRPFRNCGHRPQASYGGRSFLLKRVERPCSCRGSPPQQANRTTASNHTRSLYNTDNRAVTERVASGPRDYAALPPGVPQLGAPLPGDLGGPIVSAQQRGETVPLPPIGADAGQPNTGATPEEQARQRAVQEHKAAIASRLFLGGQSGTAPVGQEIGRAHV